MREHIEGYVRDTDGMISQSLMRALTDDAVCFNSTNTSESLRKGHMIGSSGDGLQHQQGGPLMFWSNGDSMEIEASVLCDTNDWLKRTKDQATLDDK